MPFRALASDRMVNNITKLARMSRNLRRIHDVKKGGTWVPLHGSRYMAPLNGNHLLNTAQMEI